MVWCMELLAFIMLLPKMVILSSSWSQSFTISTGSIIRSMRESVINVMIDSERSSCVAWHSLQRSAWPSLQHPNCSLKYVSKCRSFWMRCSILSTSQTSRTSYNSVKNKVSLMQFANGQYLRRPSRSGIAKVLSVVMVYSCFKSLDYICLIDYLHVF